MGDTNVEKGTTYSLKPKPRSNRAHTAITTTPSTGGPPLSAFRLTALPTKLQLEILSHVDLGGLVQLCRTSRESREGASSVAFPSMVQPTRPVAVQLALCTAGSPCLNMPPVRLSYYSSRLAMSPRA
ncbi:hypothetical protein PG994_004518 [Apiospora phragmitis]|uniref:F-box domain-containing protein n=1 Tax=Apiospora phragmitis TaxID=2905665 RepID=A0ABR1VQU0_9PEZI